jgi:hypothetical protein
MRLRSIIVAVALLFVPRLAVAQEVDVSLVLAIDVSASVTAERFELQRRGTAQAVASAEFAEAVSRGPRHAIAIAVFEWSGMGEQTVVIPWTVVRSTEEASAVAERLLVVPRAFNGSTAVGEAIYFAADLLASAPEAERRVIDVSGDGRANAGRNASAARDLAVADGNIINGLPILDVEEGLEVWYRENVQGGDRSFTQPARTLTDFQQALLTKLVREIS